MFILYSRADETKLMILLLVNDMLIITFEAIDGSLILSRS